MPALRENGPYIHPSWLPKLLAGLDHCQWKIWFQAHHDGRTWTKLDSDFNLARYNIKHTELLRLCAAEYEERGFSVTLERQSEFLFRMAGATISGRLDLVAVRDGEAVIVDAKAAQRSHAHEIQVMLYMAFLPLADSRYRELRISGEVFYGPDQTVAVSASDMDEEFMEVVKGLIGRLASQEAPRKAPSAAECRFCPIPRQYCPERVES